MMLFFVYTLSLMQWFNKQEAYLRLPLPSEAWHSLCACRRGRVQAWNFNFRLLSDRMVILLCRLTVPLFHDV